MKLVSWNVNGLRAVMGKGFMDFFRSVDADVFCLQETKLQEGQIEMDLPGYEQYWNYAEKKGYSGTAVFTKKKPLSVRYGIGIEEHDKEGRVIALEFEKCWFVTVYTPNAQRELTRLDYRMKWEDAFLAFLKELEKTKPVVFSGDLNTTHPSYISTAKRKPIIICGDLNVAASDIDIKNPKANRGSAGFTDQEREAFSRLKAAGFVDAYRYLYPDKVEYSWWSYMFKARERNAGWRIDYFLVSDWAADQIRESTIETQVLGSDHAPVSLEIDI